MTDTLSSIELQEAKVKAKHLVEVEGKQQKDVAAIVGVSEKTLSNWVIKGKWKKYTVFTAKYNDVKQLVLVQGFQQKEAAQIVGVSEKTIGAWAKKNNWKAKRRHYEKLEPDLKAFVTGFKKYLKNHSKHDYDNVSSLLDEYYNNHFLKDKKTIF